MPSFRGATLIFISFFAASILFAGTEIAIGTPAVVPAPGNRDAVASASDGRDFLVVWTDNRSGEGGGTASLLAARVTREGAVLDPFGIVLTREIPGAANVVFAGDAYAVVWSHMNQLFAARIARDGTMITPPHAVAGGYSSYGRTFLATNGQTIVAVYQSARVSYELHAVVLDRETNVLADHQLVAGPVQAGETIRTGLTIASNGDGYTVVWSALTPPKSWPDASLEAVRLDRNGQPLDATPQRIGTGDEVRVAGNPDGYFLLAREPNTKFAENLAVRSLATDLTAGASQPLPPSPHYSRTLVGLPDRFLFLYSHDGATLQAREMAGGAPLSDGRPIAQVERGFFSDSPAVATNGTELLLAWSRGAGDHASSVLEAQVFDAASLAQKTAPFVVASSANEQQLPAIAYGPGNQHLVVWRERTGLWATRVANGVSLDGRGVQLTDRRTWSPARVVFDGEQYIVAWSGAVADDPTSANVEARFISPEGAIGEPLRFSGGGFVALATSGPATLLVWGETVVNAVRLDRATRTASAPAVLPSNPGYAFDLTAAWNGTSFLVAWAETRSEEVFYPHPFPRATFRIAGLRLTPSLGVLDPKPLILGAVPGQRNLFSSLASDGREWLLAWIDEEHLRVRRIAADGTPQGEPSGTVIGPPATAIPGVVWDGARYVVASRVADDFRSFPVQLAFISPSLAVNTIVAVPSHGYVIDEEAVGLSRAPGGFAIAYSRPAYEPQFGGVDRVFMQTFARKTRAVR